MCEVRNYNTSDVGGHREQITAWARPLRLGIWYAQPWTIPDMLGEATRYRQQPTPSLLGEGQAPVQREFAPGFLQLVFASDHARAPRGRLAPPMPVTATRLLATDNTPCGDAQSPPA